MNERYQNYNLTLMHKELHDEDKTQCLVNKT